jgi:hypothetical protein
LRVVFRLAYQLNEGRVLAEELDLGRINLVAARDRADELRDLGSILARLGLVDVL